MDAGNLVAVGCIMGVVKFRDITRRRGGVHRPAKRSAPDSAREAQGAAGTGESSAELGRRGTHDRAGALKGHCSAVDTHVPLLVANRCRADVNSDGMGSKGGINRDRAIGFVGTMGNGADTRAVVGTCCSYMKTRISKLFSGNPSRQANFMLRTRHDARGPKASGHTGARAYGDAGWRYRAE